MASDASSNRSRLSQEVRTGRERVPNWSRSRGYGCRHRLDIAPFSLWNEEAQRFRLADEWEVDWIQTAYHAEQIGFQWPTIVIETSKPPSPLPSTLGCVAVRLVAPHSAPSVGIHGSEFPDLEDVRPFSFTTDYAGMRGPADPLSFIFRSWYEPTEEQLQKLATELFRICNPFKIHVLCPNVIVELKTDDGRSYQPGSLPRSLGGYAAHYHHGIDPFRGYSVISEPNTPTASYEDMSDMPRRHLHSTDSNNQGRDGRWYRLDGTSTDTIWLQSQGITLKCYPRPQGAERKPFYVSRLYQLFGNGITDQEEGICGAAIVEDDTEGEGIVAGFLSDATAHYAFAPILDEVVDLG